MLPQSKSRSSAILSFLFATLGLIIPLLTLHLGFYPWKDEEYQILCVADYRNTPLAAFTMYIGHLWSLLAGNDHVMTFRYLAYLCNTLSIIIPTIYFYRKNGSLLTATFIFLILQLCISLFGLFSYEWDTTTHLFLTIGCVLAVKYLESPTRSKIISLAVISACAIFSRIPNIAILPVVYILIFATRRNIRTSMADSAIYTISTVITSLLIIILIWGTPTAFINTWTDGNYITGHSSLYNVLFLQVWSRYPISFRYFFVWGGVFAATYFINITDIPRFVKYLLFAFITLSFIALLLVIRVTSDDTNSYPIDIFYFSTALITCIAVYKRTDIRQSILFSLTLLGFALVSYVGSDCGLYKILCMPLMPLALAHIFIFKSVTTREFYLIPAIVILICYPALRLKNPWTHEWMNKYDGIYHTIPQLEGIRHSPKDVNRRTQIYEWAKAVEDSGDKILFLGSDRYMFDYLLGHNSDNLDRYPLQRYHDDNDFADIERPMLEMADNFDFICLGFEFDANMRQKISNKLADKGFSLYLSEQDYTIWQK